VCSSDLDEEGNFIVFELKLSRGADKALGQILRYMGWVKKNLANDKLVKGVIVANKVDEKIKYAVMMTSDITLYEYEMNFVLSRPKE
jgi:RecB family endonuclease NucS